MSIAGTGIIDLVLETTGTSRPAEIWVEVKTGAPETRSAHAEDPGQLARYRDHLARRTGRSGLSTAPAYPVGLAIRLHPVAAMGKALGGGSIRPGGVAYVA